MPRSDPIVKFIAAERGMAAQLLAVHVDDGTGRCRVCSSGGGQTGRYQYPWAIRLAVAAAQRGGSR